jgi:FixJ family two-component response regulator
MMGKRSLVSVAAADESVRESPQVGGELGISEITVNAHRGQVMRKMRADSLPDLVTMAARLGLRLRRTTDLRNRNWPESDT